METRVKINVRGVVQGVNFRWYTKNNADRLGVQGWVMNLPDGSVEGCFEGEGAAVRALVDWCRQGPPQGRVDEVLVVDQEFMGEFTGFIIRS